MKFDLSTLNLQQSSTKDIVFTIDSKNLKTGTFKMNEPLNFKGILKCLDQIIYIDGVVSGLLYLNCSRCLDEVEYPLDLEIHEKLTYDIDNRDDDFIFIDTEVIDLQEIIENNINFSLPMKILCTEKCKGLCPVCGINKNHDSCHCDDDVIDPRLEKLKELFSNTEEV
ncbi:YceD family protein [Clostridium cellulovorans]|uniref:DUF177 domain-containing protein n=1 Tax=Clostridium cellulovorans (strain ATCC 35296 / DSM 3052 / OCM 3 / 743B) TaxID=573061 RepID=D9SLC1_CLOC7|nr:DUF177 domain-containing protein [Clostridium cellulovorans]ADL51637.1 protein of unknown function DUF177 [Clostridium cellulovorans 743B]